MLARIGLDGGSLGGTIVNNLSRRRKQVEEGRAIKNSGAQRQTMVKKVEKIHREKGRADQ